MGACATKPKVLKDVEGNTPLTKELEPPETVPEAKASDSGEKGKEVVEVEVVQAETSGNGGGSEEGEISRQSLDVLLKEVDVKESVPSTDHPVEKIGETAATPGDEKTPTAMVEANETEQPKAEEAEPKATAAMVEQPNTETPAVKAESDVATAALVEKSIQVVEQTKTAQPAEKVEATAATAVAGKSAAAAEQPKMADESIAAAGVTSEKPAAVVEKEEAEAVMATVVEKSTVPVETQVKDKPSISREEGDVDLPVSGDAKNA